MGKVIDFAAARARLARPAPENLVLKALDTLALALAAHRHRWTDEERRLYECAVERAADGAGCG